MSFLGIAHRKILYISLIYLFLPFWMQNLPLLLLDQQLHRAVIGAQDFLMDDHIPDAWHQRL